LATTAQWPFSPVLARRVSCSHVRAGGCVHFDARRDSFESVGKTRAWWVSSHYVRAKAIRQGSANSSMVVVEGVWIA
jgi:hypothetical protein